MHTISRPSILACVFVTMTAANSSFAQGVPNAGERSVRVMTYNIHHGTGNADCATPRPAPGHPPNPDCGLDLDAIADVIRAESPDIVGLQEVDRFWARSGGVDQPAVLAAALGMHHCYGANLSHGPDSHATVPHQYGTAILSRFPILDCTNTFLPRGNPGTEQRGLLSALINVRGVPLRFHNTHLHTRFADRRVQIQEIVRLIGAPSDPTVLVGDLNAIPSESTMAPLYSALEDAWLEGGDGGAGNTFPAHPVTNPNRRIDYVFVSDAVGVSRAEVAITPLTRLASDHYPLVAALKLPGSQVGIGRHR